MDEMAEWEGLARTLARRYFAHGHDPEDLLQEARIGVLKGLRAWQPGAGKRLGPFLWLTTERHLQTLVTTVNREKRDPGAEAFSMQSPVPGRGDEEPGAMEDVLGTDRSTEEQVLQREELREHLDRIDTLSDRERAAVIGPALGFSYDEVPGRNRKAVDNARQRALHKLRNPGKPFRRRRCIGSRLPTRRRNMSENPIIEATQEAIADTEDWREREMAKIREAAESQIQALEEIIAKAKDLPMNGASPFVPPQAGTSAASAKVEITSPIGSPPGAATSENPKLKHTGTVTGLEDEVARKRRERERKAKGKPRRGKYAERQRERREDLLEALKRAGPSGLSPREMEREAPMPTQARQQIVKALMDEGLVRMTGSRSTLRYFGREPETEDSPAG